MADYRSLIDAETWAFTERATSLYPADASALKVADQRAAYERMCRAFFAGYPSGARAQDGTIEPDGRRIPFRHHRADATARVRLFDL